MSQELILLVITSASMGFIHTLLGPDHYLPFIVISRARKWSLIKTSWITFLCGLGHIGSSVLLGMIGIMFGIEVSKLKVLESVRGNIAGWLFIAFGLVYFIWGLRRAFRNQPHEHRHFHNSGDNHIHQHTHIKEHTHIHNEEEAVNLTPWILFTIFVFGPCEPLIPLIMYPAAKGNFWDVALVTGVFGATTIITMLSIVIIMSLGVNLVRLKKIERYSHALAGATIFLCGVAIQFLGL
jgi:nickel/cobalt transporter (NicO) family protein